MRKQRRRLAKRLSNEWKVGSAMLSTAMGIALDKLSEHQANGNEKLIAFAKKRVAKVQGQINALRGKCRKEGTWIGGFSWQEGRKVPFFC